jgi:hypothetical protein
MMFGRSILSVGALLALLATFGLAEDAKKKDEKPNGKSSVIKSKVEPAHRAAAIDFAAVLGLDFDSLSGLGARIDQGRKAADPVGLLNAAQELAAAEKVSGKKAALTAQKLREEAVKLAKLRGHSKELKALSLLVKDGSTAKDLDTLAASAAKREAAEAKALAAGEKARGTTFLKVENYTPITATIYVNGTPVGYVGGNAYYSFYLGKKYDTVVLEASGVGGHWGPRVIAGYFDNYTWTLTP